VDAFLVVHPPNLYYLCGFSGSSGALLVGRRATLLTDGRYTIQARQEVRAARVKIGPRWQESLAALLRPKGRGKLRVGVEAAHLSVSQLAALRRAAGRRIRWAALEGQVEALRRAKDAEEVRRMRAAAALASRIVGEVVRRLHPGMLETEVAAEIEYRMRRAGASGPAFETIVASGARAALPHARATGKPLRKNELVVLDLGAILRHYSSDLTRTVYLGRAPSRIRTWYAAVLEAQQAAREAIQPGITAGEVDAAARGVLRRAGLARYFVHSTGHGLGLEVHEEPRLARSRSERLEAGMVVTVEPGIYVQGIGGIRIEDDVLVTERGSETLTTAPRELLEI